MDPLTHTLTGILLARTGLRRAYPRPGLLLALAANAPDMDIVTTAGGSLTYFHYHRWITHSVLLLPVVAALVTLLVCGLRRSMRGFSGAWLIACVAVATHLALDWTNAYGIRLLSPWSNRWFRGDLTGVIDPCIWTVLLAALAAPLIGRLVSAEMGARGGSGAAAAMLGLAFLVVYNGGRALLHSRALDTFEARLYDGAAPERTAAFPAGANPLAWRGVVETDTSYRLYDLNLLDVFDPAECQTVYKPDPSPAIDAARATRTFRWFLEFSQFPLWTVLPADDSPRPEMRVTVRDARFGFSAQALVDAAGRVTKDQFRFGAPRL